MVHAFICQPFILLGNGMGPTLEEGRFYLLDKLTHHFRMPLRGEIVCFRSNENPPLYFVARVLALPGETLSIRAGKIWIGKTPIDREIPPPNPSWSLGPLQVHEGTVYVLEDNRVGPLETHLHTQLARKNIVGRILFRDKKG